MGVKGEELKKSFSMFSKIRVLVCSALFVAMSIVLGKFVPLVNINVLRFSLENLPILMSGIVFGPAVGALVGGIADIVGCILVGYQINPIVTLGAITVGFISGFFSFYVVKKFTLLKIAVSVGTGHIFGSVLVKSFGLAVYYDWSIWFLMLIRLLNYAIIAVCETAIIYLLLKNKFLYSQFEKMRR